MCEALRRYRGRECFVREALARLHELIANGDKPRPDILKVLPFIPSGASAIFCLRVCDGVSAEVTVMLISPMKRWLET